MTIPQPPRLVKAEVPGGEKTGGWITGEPSVVHARGAGALAFSLGGACGAYAIGGRTESRPMTGERIPGFQRGHCRRRIVPQWVVELSCWLATRLAYPGSRVPGLNRLGASW